MTPTFFDLMGGIGGIRLGLERAGWKCMGYCENDKYSRRTYYANFGGADEFDWEDARTLPVDKIPDFDMLASGFPCFWHACPRYGHFKLPQSRWRYWRKKITANVRRDEREWLGALQNGFRVHVVWECRLKEALKRGN